MNCHRLTPEAFEELAMSIHQVTFNETRPMSENRFDYALVMADEHEMFAYATIIEMDFETAYMQHGGAFPGTRGTTRSKSAYRLIINWLKERYKRISTRIENTNVAMIKFALSEGLLIDGCFAYGRGDVYLSLGWGF